MASLMPERDTLAGYQMGGEGAAWIASRRSLIGRMSSRTLATARTSTLQRCDPGLRRGERRHHYKILLNGRSE
jgi:hypothetical protein